VQTDAGVAFGLVTIVNGQIVAILFVAVEMIGRLKSRLRQRAVRSCFAI